MERAYRLDVIAKEIGVTQMSLEQLRTYHQWLVIQYDFFGSNYDQATLDNMWYTIKQIRQRFSKHTW